LNWVVGGRDGRPRSDTWDQQAANVAETFLGLGNAFPDVPQWPRPDTLNLSVETPA
jgi:hypothetical protein